jgi:hypothetical protein
MRSFERFLDAKGWQFNEEGIDAPAISPADKFGIDPDEDRKANPYDSVLGNIIKYAYHKYKEETNQFLNDLAQRDSKIREMVNKVNQGDKEDRLPPARVPPNSKDEVVPSSADAGSSDQTGD